MQDEEICVIKIHIHKQIINHCENMLIQNEEMNEIEIHKLIDAETCKYRMKKLANRNMQAIQRENM